MEMLTTLRTIREAMIADSKNGGANDSKELEKLKKENEELKKVNTKQAYRINHLVANMEKMLQK